MGWTEAAGDPADAQVGGAQFAGTALTLRGEGDPAQQGQRLARRFLSQEKYCVIF